MGSSRKFRSAITQSSFGPFEEVVAARMVQCFPISDSHQTNSVRFGVVTGATIKVHPTFPITVSRFFINGTKSGIMEASAYFLQQGAKLRDTHGVQGYFYVYPGGFQSVLHMPDKFAAIENARNVTETLMKEMERIAGAKHIEPKYYQHKTYRDWYVAEMGDEDMEDNGTRFLSFYDGR
jgi:hypothetical protein